MIGTLDELLVVSDIDNTLLNAVEGLPEVNRATVQLFSSMGGRFTVATGRTVESVRRYLGDVAISAPVIALGGAVIYDFAQEQYIQNITLNKESAMAALREVQQNFPGVGIEVMTAAFKLCRRMNIPICTPCRNGLSICCARWQISARSGTRCCLPGRRN